MEDDLSTAGALIPVQGRENQKKGKAFSWLGSCSYVKEQAIRCASVIPLAFVIDLKRGLGFSEYRGDC